MQTHTHRSACMQIQGHTKGPSFIMAVCGVIITPFTPQNGILCTSPPSMFHARHLGASLELASDILQYMGLWVESNT
jgi:hypothetical protein